MGELDCHAEVGGSFEMQHVLHPQPGDPFTLALVISSSLETDGLTMTTEARNLAIKSLPYAAGQLPLKEPVAPTGSAAPRRYLGA